MKDLIRLIEELRVRLYKIAQAKSISHPDVLSASQLLDRAINQYLFHKKQGQEQNLK